MIAQLKAVGRTILGIGAAIAWTIRFLWALGFLIFTGLLVVDLCRIFVSVNSGKYAAKQTLWRKMSSVEEQKIKKCRGIAATFINIMDFFTTTVCRKKLTKAKPYLWQI